jgi:hypothetical protein
MLKDLGMECNVDVTRREALGKLCGAIAAAALAPWSGAEARGAKPLPSGVKTPAPTIPASGAEKLHFFTSEEKELIATVADLIIPTDEVSPGARAVGVPEWIDFVVANSPVSVQQQWREGLAALEQVSLEAAGQRFLQLLPERRRNLLEQLAQREFSPATAGERFFALAKEAAVNGYYTSEIGLRKDLQYQGGSYVEGPEAECPAKGSR